MSSREAVPTTKGPGSAELRDGYAELCDVRLHYVEAGDGPLVVLLHGFPEFWYGWRLQIAPLAAAGFRVVAPDLRGLQPVAPSRTASPPTAPTTSPPTSAVSSRSAAPSPRSWPATTGAAPPPGRSR